MGTKLRNIEKGYRVTLDADFSEQVEIFRRTEPRHRNSYRELAKCDWMKNGQEKMKNRRSLRSD